jgi:hypothetical protein
MKINSLKTSIENIRSSAKNVINGELEDDDPSSLLLRDAFRTAETNDDISKTIVDESDIFNDATEGSANFPTTIHILENLRIPVTTEEPTFSEDLEEFVTTNTISLFNYFKETSNLSTVCPSNMFCDGKCLEKHQICDSLNDWTNHIDEDDCHFPSCNSDEFPCLGGRCIPSRWKYSLLYSCENWLHFPA